MEQTIRRTFIPGGEWVYYKIYTGPKTADAVLTEILLPFVNDKSTVDIISEWFFIRYQDPHFHLRIRFKVRSINQIGRVIANLQKLLEDWVNDGRIWKVNLDTYNRELERYGFENIIASENLFCYDSMATIKFLDLIEGSEGEQLRWLYGLRSIDCLLEDFNYDLEEKEQLLESLKTSFGSEFGMSRFLKKQIDEKYRFSRHTINGFLSKQIGESSEYEEVFLLLKDRTKNSQTCVSKIINAISNQGFNMTKNELLGSYIHMLMNRLFKSKNRIHEMVVYDFLYRYYVSKRARLKHQKT